MTRRRQEPVMFGIAASAIVLFVVVPMVALAANAPEAHAYALLGSARLWTLFAVTIVRALAITAIAVALGVPLGFLLARTDVGARRIALLVHAFPMFLPPFLLALGWFHVLGSKGILGSDRSSALLFATPGLVVVLVLAFTPIITALTALALAGIDPTLEDAGRVAASRWRVATRISLPIAWPSAALGALVVFALAAAELGVPMFLRVEAYPAAVFARLGGLDYAPGEALVLVVPMVAVSVGLLAIERALIGRRPFTVLGVRRHHGTFELGRWRVPVTIAVWLVVIVGALPIVALVARASGGLAAVGDWTGDSVRNSVVDGMLGATAITLLGLVIGHALARRRRGAAVIDAIAVLGFVAPAAVVGVGLVTVWNRSSTSAIYGTSAIVVIGYLARYAVIGIRPIAAAIGQASPHLEEAAAASGAGFLRRMIAIVAPLHRRAIGAAWLLAFVFCLRDETALLYYPPGGETLPVRIFTLEANGPEPVVAALAVLQIAITALIVAAGGVLLRRSRA